MAIIGASALLLSDLFRFVHNFQIILDLTDIYKLVEKHNDDRFLSFQVASFVFETGAVRNVF
jgi:hypothetical protein